MNWFKRASLWAWDGLGNIVWITGIIASYSLPAWAVHATGIMAKFAPLSWVCSGFIGAMLFSGMYALCGWAKNQYVTAAAKAQYYRQTDRFNPMDAIFQNQRIAISDLANPMEQVVRNKKFLGCEMIGPANLLLLVTHPNAGKFIANNLTKFDAVIIADDAVPESVLEFVDCDFERCAFYNVVLLFREKDAAEANTAVRGMHWISPNSPTPVGIGPSQPIAANLPPAKKGPFKWLTGRGSE